MWQTASLYVGLQISRKILLSLEVRNFYDTVTDSTKNLFPFQLSNNILGGVTTVNNTINVCLTNDVLL